MSNAIFISLLRYSSNKRKLIINVVLLLKGGDSKFRILLMSFYLTPMKINKHSKDAPWSLESD